MSDSIDVGEGSGTATAKNPVSAHYLLLHEDTTQGGDRKVATTYDARVFLVIYELVIGSNLICFKIMFFKQATLVKN